MSRIDVDPASLRELVINAVETEEMIEEVTQKVLKMLRLAEECRDSQGQKIKERAKQMQEILWTFKNVTHENIDYFKKKLEQAEELERD